MKSSTLLRILWITAGLALVLAWVRAPALQRLGRGKVLSRVSGGQEEPWFTGGFRADGAYPSTTDGLLPRHIPRLGSWVDADAFQGRTETAWFVAPRVVQVGVAGYPKDPGCKLWAEFRNRDGTVTRLDCPLGDPREQWNVWEFDRPDGATAVRIVADDRATGPGGWLAFSHPFASRPLAFSAAYLHAQVYTTVALALTLLFGPGLLWRPRRPAAEIGAVFLLGAGPLLLALAGLAIWLLSGVARPQLLGCAFVLLLWLGLGASVWRRGFDLELPAAWNRAFALTGLIVVAVAAKSSYSVGPAGELFRGTISRNFTIGDRIDSRYSYYVVQAAARHLSPAEPATETMFYPWTFFSRGPLAGLIALPVVMATDGRPPATPPDQPWSPFDREGFAAYRITLLVLASGIIPAVFLLLAPFVGERWALIGAGLLALSPFGVHEVMFTWPKWVATTWAALSFSLAHARRPLAAGGALAAGFFFHPLVLLWAPWLGMWTLVRTELRFISLATAALRFGAGVGAFVLPWMALGAWMPHLPDTPFAGQGGFLRYWFLADWQPATWATWWHSRAMTFANTFLPLHVLFHPASYAHPKFTSAYEQSGPLVKFAQVWWVSLPFALGLGLWAGTLAGIVKAARAFTAATVVFVFGPALFITAYWGMDPLGLMRECGHPLAVAIIALTCLAAARHAGRLGPVLEHRAVPWLQLPETWLMLWLTALANPHPPGVQANQLDPLCLVINAAALLAAARLLMRVRSSPEPKQSPFTCANPGRVAP